MKSIVSSIATFILFISQVQLLPSDGGGAPAASGGGGQNVIFQATGEINNVKQCGSVPIGSDVKVRINMGKEDFQGGAMCGKCLSVKGPGGEVVGTVVSQCGKLCVPGTIQMDPASATKINPNPTSGVFPVTWKVVDCKSAGTGSASPAASPAAPGASLASPASPAGAMGGAPKM